MPPKQKVKREPNVLLTNFINANFSSYNSFEQNNEYMNLYLTEWVHWNDYYDRTESGPQNPNSIPELAGKLHDLCKDINILMHEKRKRFRNYAEQISELLMQQTSINNGIELLVNKYKDNALSDENVVAAFKSKHRQPSSDRYLNLKHALYIELEILLSLSLESTKIPLSTNDTFSVLEKNESIISSLGIDINYESM